MAEIVHFLLLETRMALLNDRTFSFKGADEFCKSIILNLQREEVEKLNPTRPVHSGPLHSIFNPFLPGNP